MNYSNHTDEELACHVDLAQDPLTTTDLERVLLGRFEALMEEARANELNAGLLEVLDEFDLDPATTKGIEHAHTALQFAFDYDLKTVRALLELASEHDIDTAELLKPRLELADQFDQVREDAGTAISDLNKIFNPTTA